MAKVHLLGFFGLLALCSSAFSEVMIYREPFDSVATPLLPAGWTSSQNRTPGQADFFTTSSSAHSVPNALQCTNATIAQWVLSPPIGGSERVAASISFWTRRSGTFGAALVLECAPDGEGLPFVMLGDTIRFSGSILYEVHEIQIPVSLRSPSSLRFRWRIVPSASGATGTFRLDDIEVDGECALDLACGPVSAGPASSAGMSARMIRTKVRNAGRDAVARFGLTFLLNPNADSVSRGVRELGNISLAGPLAAGDSVWVECSLSPAAPGGALIAVASCAGDLNAANDSATISLPVAFAPGTLVINEMMFAPAAHDPEWIEVENPTGDTIALSQWTISDADRDAAHRVARAPYIVPPSGYAILTDDSTGLYARFGPIACPVIQVPGFPSLNNDEDMVVLADHTGSTIDSVAYRSSWHNPALVSATGRSLERISPELPSCDSRSWTSTTSLQGGTPGMRNSVVVSSRNRKEGLECSPNPFSPDNDGVNDVTLVRYAIPLPVATISAFVYDIRGRRIRRLADHDAGTSQGVLVWDGRRDDGVRAPVGMYIVVFRAVRADGGSLYEARCVVVLAMPM